MPSSPVGLTFQDAVHRLERYWADQGCLVWMPHNVEVGAGTMNPSTFLYVLGPEPWNVAYLEPGIRPDDARFGENPNRLGRHHQFQVILKPDPGDPQALYLASLAAIGIDLAKHDIRFVEDNWESPALGAWGLGWEVWLDGLEITQFTYFQQAGSLDLNPNAIEITYGVDRILMALQDVTHFRQLQWNEHVTFDDVMYPSEVETSKYYFETANVERLRQLYDLLDAEATDALAAGLVRPAHDYILKCSHIFNVMDARGAVGVTERARFFARMRKLSRAVAEGYLKEREALGFPLLRGVAGGEWVAGRRAESTDAGATAEIAMASDATATSGPAATPAASAVPESASSTQDSTLPTAPADFLLEIGTEELPVDDLNKALAALGERIPALLADLRLTHGDIAVWGTPRRLAIFVEALAARQYDLETEVVGPPVKAAYDAEGKPTPATLGFARNAGVAPDQLKIVEQKGERRIAATRREVGKPAGEVLAPALATVIRNLPAARGMRWNASGESFSRPVRWLVALHGDAVVPVAFAGLVAGRLTRGLRPAGSPSLALGAAGDYRELMALHGILVDPAARKAEVLRQVTVLAESAGGRIAEDPGLLDEVTHLVEQPHAVLGDFEAEYLDLPAPVLVTVMKKHQRYFPLQDADGRLLPHFITVANGAGLDDALVRHGNAAVIRARFADAAYFWKKDTAQPLADYTPALAGLSFQADLGSMLDKVKRLEALVPVLAGRLGLDEAETRDALRAAALAKSDLVTSMVVDFTSLQGTMGRTYAKLAGEPEAVARAIEEQYLPKGAGVELPESRPGMVLALADRLDSLVGLFAAGMRPKGANDPYALRRAALGITSILVGRKLDFDLPAAVDAAAALLPVTLADAARSELLDFIAKRLEGQLRDAGHAADAVAAVLAAQSGNPAAAVRAVASLEAHVARPAWPVTLTAYARCARIMRGRAGADGGTADPALFQEPAETALSESVEAAAKSLDRGDLDAVLQALEGLAPAINTFFDAVLVMAEDTAVRANRLALVARVAELPAAAADLSQMEGF